MVAESPASLNYFLTPPPPPTHRLSHHPGKITEAVIFRTELDSVVVIVVSWQYEYSLKDVRAYRIRTVMR